MATKIMIRYNSLIASMRVPRATQWIALALCSALAGCAADKYSFVRYGQTRDPHTHTYPATGDPLLTDRLALNYAASVASILRSKYQGARITREASSTAQIILAGLGGAGASAFGYSPSALAVIGLGGAGIPELQRIFGAKERAQVYQDAVRLIEEAEVDYLAHNQRPSDSDLTQNGVTLFQRVTASLHVVEKTLAGNLPSIEDMQKATERMTEAGAVLSEAGEPAFNLTPANGDPPMAKSDLAKFSGRRNPTVTVTGPQGAPKTDPNRQTNFSLTPDLARRSAALQRAFNNLTPDATRQILKDKGLTAPADATATQLQELLATRILTEIQYDPLPTSGAVDVLGAYRRSLKNEKSISRLEKIYKDLGITIPQVEPIDLQKRNKAIADAFENIPTDSAAMKKLLENNSAATPEILAGLILDSGGLKIINGSTAIRSLMRYRFQALNDLALTERLEKGLRGHKMPGFDQP